jgi:hypothetical protein
MGYFQRSNPGCCIKSKNDFSKNTAETVSDACTFKSPNFPRQPSSAPVRQDPAPIQADPKGNNSFLMHFRVFKNFVPTQRPTFKERPRLFNGAAKVAGFFIPAIFCHTFF